MARIALTGSNIKSVTIKIVNLDNILDMHSCTSRPCAIQPCTYKMVVINRNCNFYVHYTCKNLIILRTFYLIKGVGEVPCPKFVKSHMVMG